ncbi:MAG: hypothetical protein GY795_29100 [Desulfobacterales bacterium]|nr:hypothetical protein [Desulfobacterales bacterium]
METDGFRLTVHDYERIRLALGTGGTRVRSVLAALLAKDEDQAQDFFRRFDDFFDPELQEKSLQVDVQKVIDDLQEFGNLRNVSFKACFSFILLLYENVGWGEARTPTFATQLGFVPHLQT